MCMCGSMSPGRMKPPGLRVFVDGVTSPSTSDRDPMPMMRSPEIAMASAVGAAGLFVMMSPTTSRSAVAPVGLAAAWFAGVTESGAPARAGARCALPSSFGWQQEVLESMSFPS